MQLDGAAFVAGSLIFKNDKSIDNLTYANDTQNIQSIVDEANKNLNSLQSLLPKLEDDELVKDARNVCNTSKKIIDTLSKNPEKLNQVNNFLNYYLPVTIKILTRYDEIENQKLTSANSVKFMSSVKEMVKKISTAFEEQLANMYQTEIIDTDAEIKVFESMLKSDGFIEEMNFNINKKEK